MNRFFSTLLTFAFFLIASCSLPRTEEVFKETRVVMGTVVGISVVSTDRSKADAAIRAAFDEMQRLDSMMNPSIPESAVSAVNHGAGKEPVPVPVEMMEVLKEAMEVHRISGGLFDVTVGPLINLWGIGTNPPRVPSQKEIGEAMALTGADDLVLDFENRTVFLKRKGMVIDLGGIAKGYAADRAMEVLLKNGIKSAVVAVAGDIRAMGKKPGGAPWHIGIRHPRKEDALLASFDLTDRAVSTAGDYERFFIMDGVRYHHVLDPSSGMPASKCQSASVVAARGIDTDPISTAVFLLGPLEGMALVERLSGVEALIVDSDGRVSVSSGLTGKVEIP